MSRIGDIIKKVTQKKEGGTFAGNLIRDNVGSLSNNIRGRKQNNDIIKKQPEQTNYEPKGLSTGAWVGIGFGALALIGIITYYTTKNK